MEINNVVIIGSGPAGLTCAIYLARSGLSPIVVTGDKPGGQLTNTDIIENYPGIVSVNGAQLMMDTIDQAKKLGTKLVFESVTSVSRNSSGSFEITLSSSKTISSKAVLIATGTKHRHLEVPGEIELTNKGVSWCATCDGPLYRGKVVGVVGGGNTAVMEACFLSTIASKVYLIHRRDALRAEKIMQDRLFACKNVELVWNSEVSEIKGDCKVQSVVLSPLREIELSALFVAIGTIPSCGFVKGMIELDSDGCVIVSGNTMGTSVPGVFAAGDIVSGSVKQAIVAAGQGCQAAISIERYLGVR